MTDIACILLAAGTGSRFGGDKLLYPLNGKSMAAHAIELHASLPYACRILVTQRRHTAIASLAESNGFLIGYNEAPERGIASSIRIAMELLALQPCPPDGMLFGVCDQPYLRAETVLRLIARFCAEPARIVAPMANGRRGNPVIFPARFAAELAALTGDTGGSRVIRAHPEALFCVPCDAAELTDVDVPPQSP